MKQVTNDDLERLTSQAAAAARRRAHLNVHAVLEESVQRLFIAFEPGTYVRPHRHPQPNKWELVVLIAGAIDLLLFDAQGRLETRIPLTTADTRAAEIPANVWHSYVCREPGTILLEVKEGPYIPTAAGDFASWSPPEGDTVAVAPYLERLRTATPDGAN